MHAAVERLDPFGIGGRNSQTHGDIRGHVITAHAHAVGIDHVFFHEDRHAGRAAAKINTGCAQFLFVFHQRRNARHVCRRCDPGELEVAAFDAADKVLDRMAIDCEHMHVHAEVLSQLTTRVDQARPVVEREVHRLGVQHIAPCSVFRHITGGQHASNFVFSDHLAFEFHLRVQTVGPGAGS